MKKLLLATLITAIILSPASPTSGQTPQDPINCPPGGTEHPESGGIDRTNHTTGIRGEIQTVNPDVVHGGGSTEEARGFLRINLSPNFFEFGWYEGWRGGGTGNDRQIYTYTTGSAGFDLYPAAIEGLAPEYKLQWIEHSSAYGGVDRWQATVTYGGNVYLILDTWVPVMWPASSNSAMLSIAPGNVELPNFGISDIEREVYYYGWVQQTLGAFPDIDVFEGEIGDDTCATADVTVPNAYRQFRYESFP